MNPPQQITNRYVNDLLHHGSNHDFNIEHIERKPNIVNGLVCGEYWEVSISCSEGLMLMPGNTIAQAARRALENLGVTFRVK